MIQTHIKYAELERRFSRIITEEDVNTLILEVEAMASLETKKITAQIRQPSKHNEKSPKMDKAQIKHEIEKLNLNLRERMRTLMEAYANHLFDISYKAQKQKEKEQKKEFTTWLEEQFKQNPNLSESSRKDMSGLYKAYHKLTGILIATLRTWHKRKRRL